MWVRFLEKEPFKGHLVVQNEKRANLLGLLKRIFPTSAFCHFKRIGRLTDLKGKKSVFLDDLKGTSTD